MMRATLAEDRWAEGLRVLRRVRASLDRLFVWELLPRHFRLPRTKPIFGRVLAVLLSSTLAAFADAPPKVQYQRGPCAGGNKPSSACKTCAHCAYCGPKRHPGGTCAVCEKAPAALDSSKIVESLRKAVVNE
jgi:hypothetical protein